MYGIICAVYMYLKTADNQHFYGEKLLRAQNMKVIIYIDWRHLAGENKKLYFHQFCFVTRDGIALGIYTTHGDFHFMGISW